MFPSLDFVYNLQKTRNETTSYSNKSTKKLPLKYLKLNQNWIESVFAQIPELCHHSQAVQRISSKMEFRHVSWFDTLKEPRNYPRKRFWTKEKETRSKI